MGQKQKDKQLYIKLSNYVPEIKGDGINKNSYPFSNYNISRYKMKLLTKRYSGLLVIRYKRPYRWKSKLQVRFELNTSK